MKERGNFLKRLFNITLLIRCFISKMSYNVLRYVEIASDARRGKKFHRARVNLFLPIIICRDEWTIGLSVLFFLFLGMFLGYVFCDTDRLFDAYRNKLEGKPYKYKPEPDSAFYIILSICLFFFISLLVYRCIYQAN